MTFVTAGLAIAGALAVAIPIIIHLLARQRRKPIEWAAMRFLLEAFRKHKRRLQLEQIILLTVRCLIVALLGAALARPILEGAGLLKTGGSRAVYLVIDDGMASGLTNDERRSALDRHIQDASELVSALGLGDAVGLVTAARPAQALLVPPSTDRSAVIEVIRSLTPKESPTDLAGAFSFVRNAVDESRKTRQPTLMYLFSEFRNGSAALDSPLPSTHAQASDDISLLVSPPATDPQVNLQVISIEPVRSVVLPGTSDGSGQVTVRLRRSGSPLTGDVSTVRLTGDGLPPTEPRTVQWQPGQTESNVEFMINFGEEIDREIGVTASIDDDALNADNQRHAVLELRKQIRVLLVDRRNFGLDRAIDKLTAGQWIRRALEPVEGGPIQIVEAEPAALDMADVRTADVVMLVRPDLISDSGWVVLRSFIQQNGLLIVMPPGEVNVHPWTERLTADLNLPWSVSLEAVEYPDGLALAQEQPTGELMRLISSELSELARPVIAHRVLPVGRESDTGANGRAQAGGDQQVLLVFADGSPMIIAGVPSSLVNEAAPPVASNQSQHHQANGLVVYMGIAPDASWSNLPLNPLMVPLFQELIRQGLSVIRAAQRMMVGEQPSLSHNAGAHDLIDPQGNKVALDQAARLQQPLQRAGVYGVLDQSEQHIGKLAVNVDAAAGTTDLQSSTAVTSWLGNSGPWREFEAGNIVGSLGNTASGSPIAGILLSIVLILVILETLLARWFSHAYETRVGDQHPAFGSQTARLKPQVSS